MKIKATVVKSVLVDAGPYRTKSFRNAVAAAKFYAWWSHVNYIERVGVRRADIDSNRQERLYRRVLPIFRIMLK